MKNLTILQSKSERQLIAWGLISALIPFIYVVFGFGFKWSNLSLPLHGSGDELLYATNVKALMTSWSPINPFFGGFGGQDLNFALVSVDLGAPFLAALFATLFNSTPFFGMNLLFILSFPLTGLVAYESFRRLGAQPFLSSLGGIAYSTLGFHAIWNTSSITISNYWYLPACIAIFLGLVSGKLDLFNSRRPILTTFGILGLAFLSGVFYSYWAFALTSTYVVWIIVAATQKVARKQIVSAIWFALVTVLGFAVASIPSLMAYSNTLSSINYLKERHFAAGLSNGNTLTSYFNYPIGGLSQKMMSAVFPDYQEKMDYFFSFMVGKGFAGESLSYSQAIPLGIIAGVLVVLLARTRFFDNETIPKGIKFQIQLLSLGSLAIVLLSTIGGFGALFSMFGSSALRGFGRFVILLVLFLLFILTLSASYLKTSPRENFFRIFVSVLLVLASLENVSNPVQAKVSADRILEINSPSALDAPNKTETIAVTAMIAGVNKLNSDLEARLSRCTILSLPVTHYPYESPGYPTYRLLLPGLISKNLNWTAGAVGGSLAYEKLLPLRDEIDSGGRNLITSARSSGYCAVVLDVTAWNAMHHFKPWVEYVGHPRPAVSEFLESSGEDWTLLSTPYGDYAIFYL